MKRLVAFLCLFLFFGMFAYADVGYDGYIVKIKNDCATYFATLYADEETVIENNVQASLFLAESHDGVGVIYSPEGLIKAKDENTLQELVEMGIVEYAEPDLICELYGYVPENNPLYAKQWAHEAINSEYAWDNGIYGQEVKVAVIDSGVSMHPDLEPCLLPGGDFEGLTERGETPGTDTTDNVWHGTFVAGVIAAQCNDIGVVGLSHNVKIVPLKVCDSTKFNISYVIPAIYAAVDDYDCDVINLSLGVSTTQSGGVRYVNGVYESGTIPASISVSNAINHATMNGAIVVAASGNDGASQTIETDGAGNVIEKRHLSFPAILNNVVSVGNVKQEDTGEYAIDITSTYNEYVDISAPGTSVYSTYYKNASSSYTSATGTSFATPYVSAAAAIMKCINPDIKFLEFDSLIRSTANKSYMTESQDELYWGDGMLDIEAMLKEYFKDRSDYVSPLNVNVNTGECTVTVSNLTEEIKEYMVVIEDASLQEGQKKLVSATLSPDGSKEISLTRYGFDENATVEMTSFLRGDSNGDGSIDKADLEMLAKHLLGVITMSNVEIFRSNAYLHEGATETDVTLDIRDVIKIAQLINKSK